MGYDPARSYVAAAREKGRSTAVDQLFERLWNGTADMQEWTAAVTGGSIRPVTDNVIAIHTGYLFGNTTAIRTDTGLVLVDTGSRDTASQTLAALRRWDDGPVHTVNLHPRSYRPHVGSQAARRGG
jgi:hypothetical protein